MTPRMRTRLSLSSWSTAWPILFVIAIRVDFCLWGGTVQNFIKIQPLDFKDDICTLPNALYMVHQQHLHLVASQLVIPSQYLACSFLIPYWQWSEIPAKKNIRLILHQPAPVGMLGNSITYRMQMIRLNCEAHLKIGMWVAQILHLSMLWICSHERKHITHNALLEARAIFKRKSRCLAKGCNMVDYIVKWHTGVKRPVHMCKNLVSFTSQENRKDDTLCEGLATRKLFFGDKPHRMSFSEVDRRRVYLACRPIFTGTAAKIQKNSRAPVDAPKISSTISPRFCNRDGRRYSKSIA